MSSRLLALAVVSLVLSVLGPVAQATADPAPPLTGEVLVGWELGTPGTSQISGTCNPTGESTFSFTATGEATGPYPGTFTESGTFTLGPAVPPPSFRPLSFDASFTITSAGGTVTGTKALVGFLPSNFGACGTGLSQPGIPVPASAFQIQLTTSYSAQIYTAGGSSSDAGESLVDYGDLGVRGVPNFQGFRFLENFVSSSFANLGTGKATGGGQIAPSVTFGFVAIGQDGGPKGTCDVVDHAASVHVKCLDVTTYVQTGNEATFSGRALVNGVETGYRIGVQDGGEPGTGVDTFAIETDTGYAAGGPPTGGNIQVR